MNWHPHFHTLEYFASIIFSLYFQDCRQPFQGGSFFDHEGMYRNSVAISITRISYRRPKSFLFNSKTCRNEEWKFLCFLFLGLPYCETHYHAKRGSLCAGCSKPITGRCITAMFKKFHPEHFVCAFCLKQLNKGTFKEQNDKPYCHGCFDKLFG